MADRDASGAESERQQPQRAGIGVKHGLSRARESEARNAASLDGFFAAGNAFLLELESVIPAVAIKCGRLRKHRLQGLIGSRDRTSEDDGGVNGDLQVGGDALCGGEQAGIELGDIGAARLVYDRRCYDGVGLQLLVIDPQLVSEIREVRVGDFVESGYALAEARHRI